MVDFLYISKGGRQFPHNYEPPYIKVRHISLVDILGAKVLHNAVCGKEWTYFEDHKLNSEIEILFNIQEQIKDLPTYFLNS